MTESVVAGVDGSRSSARAVRTAAREAELRGGDLRLVHAFGWPMPHVPPSDPGHTSLSELVDSTLTEAEQLARHVAPDTETTRYVTMGDPLVVLENASRNASLVVLGGHGFNTFASLLLNSTAGHLAAHARCPVLVVRGRDDPTGPVLLAVDDSPASEAAVRFAFAEASLRGAELLAVHVSKDRGPDADAGPAHRPFGKRDDKNLLMHAERVLDTALDTPAHQYPDVALRRLATVGRVRRGLIEESANAQLLVVGARGRGGFAGLLLGSVSQACLHHAHCPVVVARGGER